jgi:hypothetical protein
VLQYECEDEFLCNIATRKESWVHNLKLENKRQSMKYHQRGLPVPKKFKTAPSAGKVMLAIFWDVNGVEHSEFMATGTITNYERYVEILQKLKA